MSLKVKNVLERTKSKFQDILVFDSTDYGRVLVLDGVVQLTERDEASYQECIAHIPIMCHRAPKRVLIVGGGDGGVLREVCKHDDIEEVCPPSTAHQATLSTPVPTFVQIVMCEIDEGVVAAAKKYFGHITATSFDDPRVTLLFQDAAEYVKEHQQAFDVIIMDSSDPVGPAESLYQDSFLSSVRSALRPGGLLCMQGECIWLHLAFIKETLQAAAQMFDVVDYAYTGVPTYPCGQIGFILCKGPKAPGSPLPPSAALQRPTRTPSAHLGKQLKYYTPKLHVAAFQLPKFAEEALAGVRASPKGGSCPWHSGWAIAGGLVLATAIGAAAGAAASKLLSPASSSGTSK